MLRRLKRLAVILVTACAVALAGPVTAAPAQDDCGGAAYCLPPPPASNAAKKRGAKKSKSSLDVNVTLAGQVGSALVYAPRGGIVTPRPSRRKRVSVPAVSVYCPSACTVSGALSLKVGRRTLRQPGLSASLKAGANTSGRLSLSRAALRRIVKARGANLTVTVKLKDLYGDHEQSIAVAVRPAPLT
jgi:hypothetical protein